MKNISNLLVLAICSVLAFSSCEKENPEIIPGKETVIANETVASESTLRSIPDQYIDAARNNLHIAYRHTSHGTHVSYGLS